MIPISLCIPTKNRFDTFLTNYLDQYVDFLERNILDEIVITDENGNDYEKIKHKYNNVLERNKNFRIFQNEECLGVFLNKRKVCSLASHPFIALIDSDNFCDETYFTTVKRYIQERGISPEVPYLLCPSFAKPNFNFQTFNGQIITKKNVREFMDQENFQVLLNTGNYILTKPVIEKQFEYDPLLSKIGPFDVIYFNLQCFIHIEAFELHVVPELEYVHVVHPDSEYLKTHTPCDHYFDHVIIPMYYQLE